MESCESGHCPCNSEAPPPPYSPPPPSDSSGDDFIRIRLIHTNRECNNSDHKYTKDGCVYDIEDRPIWYYSCRRPFDTVDENRKLELLCRFFEIDCTCDNVLCNLCKAVIYDRKIVNDYTETCSIKLLMKLYSHIDWKGIDREVAEQYK